ncbi:hypothetical protein B0T24DRAFT_693472 [Lasiosphaeria ovina]|uniref:Uncharacterized protein n=1 Tax=Lasiosphaeria ovina TaxID=92902 RepID=A0AAE0JT38_9PEZI|nr:hypothetical protein B0T24DRAFT_693472 [Lasiosphaeria ovina]
MSTIYQNALLTIAIVDNVSADEVLRKSDYRAQGDLDTRGWTLQEGAQPIASQRVPTGMPVDISPRSRNADEKALARRLLTAPAAPSPNDYRLWRAAVQSYTARYLTVPGDWYVALAGIERQMAAALGSDEAVAGIWRRDALRCLLWRVADGVVDLVARPPGVVQAPSWSWLAVPVPIQYRLFGTSDAAQEARHEARLVPRATVVALDATSEDTAGGFARYSGRLAVTGAVSKVLVSGTQRVYVATDRRDSVSGKSRWGDGLVKGPLVRDVYRQPGDWTRGGDEDEGEYEGEGWDWVDDFAATKCLLMFQSERPTGSGTQYCMVLRPTGRGANEYVRLGVCEFKRKSGASLETLHVCLESKETCPDPTAHRGDCMGDYETGLIV